MSLAFLRGQITFMRSRGFEVRAVSSPGKALAEFAEQEGAEGVAIPMTREISPGRDMGALRALRKVLRQIRPAIVHSHTPKGGLLGMCAAWLARVPVRVYHLRGLPFVTATGKRRALLRMTERVACRLAHRVICVSHSVRQVVIDDGLCPPDKIIVLAGGSGNGVDAEGRFNPDSLEVGTREAVRSKWNVPTDARVIGFIGRLVRDKGLVELTEAFATIRDDYPNAYLLLVGPEEERDPVPAEVLQQLRADDRVRMVGEEWNTPPLYAAMDLVVLPTYREGFPNVPLEAASMGRPVVATRIPGCVDAVADGETGTLVPPQDARALATAIKSYLDAEALRRAHGDAGRQRVLREFRQEVIWQALYDEYCRLLKARGLTLPAAEDSSSEFKRGVATEG